MSVIGAHWPFLMIYIMQFNLKKSTQQLESAADVNLKGLLHANKNAFRLNLKKNITFELIRLANKDLLIIIFNLFLNFIGIKVFLEYSEFLLI